MSDLKKWMNIVEQILPTVIDSSSDTSDFSINDPVLISPAHGGGVGRFIQCNGNVCTVDVKGILCDFTRDALSVPPRIGEDPFTTPIDKFHINVLPGVEELLKDKPDPQTGDVVRIENVYGTGIGPGFGTFMSYSTNGLEAIVNFDGQVLSVPVKQISNAVEQESEDKFQSTGNDGALSPMSLGTENRISTIQNDGEEPMSQKDQFSTWMAAVEEGLRNEDILQSGRFISIDDLKSAAQRAPTVQSCACQAWDCPECYPEEDQLGSISSDLDDIPQTQDGVFILDDEFTEDEYVDHKFNNNSADYAPLKRELEPSNISPEEPVEHGASDDVAELIGKIQYMQDVGLSASDKTYDTEQLMNAGSSVVKRIYDKVMGNVQENSQFNETSGDMDMSNKLIKEDTYVSPVRKLARKLYSGELSLEEFYAEIEKLKQDEHGDPIEEKSAAEFFGYGNADEEVDEDEDDTVLDSLSSIEKKIAIAKAALDRKGQDIDEEDTDAEPLDHGLNSLGNKIVNAKLKHAGKEHTASPIVAIEDEDNMAKPDEEVMEWVRRFAARDKLVQENTKRK